VTETTKKLIFKIFGHLIELSSGTTEYGKAHPCTIIDNLHY